MYLFPGQKQPAVAKYFQRELSAILGRNLKLNQIWDLIAALANLNSDAYLAQVLKSGSPVELREITDSFLQKLGEKHRITLDNQLHQLINRLLRHTPVELMPRPKLRGATSFTVYGRENPLSDAFENLDHLVYRIRQSLSGNPVDVSPGLLDLIKEWDAEAGPIKPTKKVIEGILQDLYEFAIPEKGLGFEGWVERHGMREHVKTNVERYLSMPETARELSANHFIVWAFNAYRVSELSEDQAMYLPLELQSDPDAVIGEWHCTIADDESGQGFDANLNCSERMVFVAVYRQGAWEYIGVGLGMSASGESEDALLNIADQYSEETNGMAKAVILTGRRRDGEHGTKAILKTWSEAAKWNRPLVVAMPDAAMIDPKWSEWKDDIAPFLLSRIPETPPCLVIRSFGARAEITPSDCTFYQGLPAYYPTDVVVMGVHGAQPVDMERDPMMAFALDFKEPQRLPLNEEDKQRIAERQALAEAMFDLVREGVTKIQFDPWAFPVN